MEYENNPNTQNEDLIIAKEDLSTLQESRKETQISDTSLTYERANSVLDHNINRKRAVS